MEKSALEREKAVCSDGSERWCKQLQDVLGDQDPTIPTSLMCCAGSDVNLIISEQFQDTPLQYAVKHGFLEVVEALLECKELDLEQRDKKNHTALDEAIRSLFLTTGSVHALEKRFNFAKRCRIVKCLLAVGASNLSHNFIDLLIFSNSNSKPGRQLMSKLVHLFCLKGNMEANSRLMTILAQYKFATSWVHSLLQQEADPSYLLHQEASLQSFPLATSILLATASNNYALLSQIDLDTSHSVQTLGDQWPMYRRLVKLLTLCGHELQLSVMRYLYLNHAEMYRWLAEYRASPRPLSHLCRVAVRLQLTPNVIWATQQLATMPDKLKPYLIFE